GPHRPEWDSPSRGAPPGGRRCVVPLDLACRLGYVPSAYRYSDAYGGRVMGGAWWFRCDGDGTPERRSAGSAVAGVHTLGVERHRPATRPERWVDQVGVAGPAVEQDVDQPAPAHPAPDLPGPVAGAAAGTGRAHLAGQLLQPPVPVPDHGRIAAGTRQDRPQLGHVPHVDHPLPPVAQPHHHAPGHGASITTAWNACTILRHM